MSLGKGHTVSGHTADEYIKRVAREAGDLSIDVSEELDLLSDEELLNRFSPNGNKAAERAHERHNTNELALVNDPTTNSYAVERKTNMMFGYLDDPYEAMSGMSEAEAKQKQKEKEQHDAIQAAMFDAHEEQLARQQEEYKKLDEQMHNFGGQQRSTKWITDFYNNWWDDPKNKEKLRQKLQAEGKTDEEIDDTFKKIEERKRLWNLMLHLDPNSEEYRRYQQQYLGLGTPDVVKAEDRLAAEKDRETQNNLTADRKGNEYDASFRRQGSISFAGGNPSSSDTFQQIEERKKLWNQMANANPNSEEYRRYQEEYAKLGTSSVLKAEEANESEFQQNARSATTPQQGLNILSADSTVSTDVRASQTSDLPSNEELFGKGKGLASDFQAATQETPQTTTQPTPVVRTAQITTQDMSSSMGAWGV